MQKLIDGHLIDVSEIEQIKVDAQIKNMQTQCTNINDPLDRTRITIDVKQQLKQLVKKVPEAKVLVLILLGKAETEELLKDI